MGGPRRHRGQRLEARERLGGPAKAELELAECPRRRGGLEMETVRGRQLERLGGMIATLLLASAKRLHPRQDGQVIGGAVLLSGVPGQV